MVCSKMNWVIVIAVLVMESAWNKNVLNFFPPFKFTFAFVVSL